MDHHLWRLLLPLALEMGLEERFAASGPRPDQWAAMARALELWIQPQSVPWTPSLPADQRLGKLYGPREKVRIHHLPHFSPEQYHSTLTIG